MIVYASSLSFEEDFRFVYAGVEWQVWGQRDWHRLCLFPGDAFPDDLESGSLWISEPFEGYGEMLDWSRTLRQRLDTFLPSIDFDTLVMEFLL